MFAVNPTDASDVAITFIATLPAIIAAVLMIGKRMKRVEGTVDNIQSNIQTNHGKKPSEYLEMIADIKQHSLETRMDALEMKSLVVEQAAALHDHTVNDAKNFDELKSLITKLYKENE